MEQDSPRTRRQQVHDLRNAINSMVLSARCIAQHDELPLSCAPFAKAVEESGEKARILMEAIFSQEPAVPRES
jgi:hypothetical protein